MNYSLLNLNSRHNHFRRHYFDVQLFFVAFAGVSVVTLVGLQFESIDVNLLTNDLSNYSNPIAMERKKRKEKSVENSLKFQFHRE